MLIVERPQTPEANGGEDKVLIVERPQMPEANGGEDEVLILERPQTPEANGDSDDDSDDEVGLYLYNDQMLLDKDMRVSQKVIYHMGALAGTVQVTMEGHRFAVLKLHLNPWVDVILHTTREGDYQGYVALVSESDKELFLWHVVEIAPIRED